MICPALLQPRVFALSKRYLAFKDCDVRWHDCRKETRLTTVRNALCKPQFRNYKNGFRRMAHDWAHGFFYRFQFSCELNRDRFTGIRTYQNDTGVVCVPEKRGFDRALAH